MWYTGEWLIQMLFFCYNKGLQVIVNRWEKQMITCDVYSTFFKNTNVNCYMIYVLRFTKKMLVAIYTDEENSKLKGGQIIVLLKDNKLVVLIENIIIGTIF